jgi:hypothetical protein
VVVVAGRGAVVDVGAGVVVAVGPRVGAGVGVGDVSCDVGGAAGGSLKITFGLGPIVTEAPGGTVVCPVAAVGRAGPVVVVVVVGDPGRVVVEDVGEDVVEVAPGIVDGGVEVLGTTTLVAAKWGLASAARPVDGPLELRVVAATSRPQTMNATTSPITVLERDSLLFPSHQWRTRSPALGRPKAAFFPMDRRNGSRPSGRAGGGGPIGVGRRA